MNKYIMSFIFTTSLSYAGLVNGIAILVNDEPITLYDIDLATQNSNISKQQAVDTLIDEMLYAQELKKQNITVDIFDIDTYIEKLADQNNMSTLDFKSLVRQQQNYELFTQDIKKQLIHQKLISKIAVGKLNIADEDDLKLHYKNNKEQFKIANTIDAIVYISKNKALLNQLKSNPMLQIQELVMQELTFKQDELNPQVKYIINSTNIKEFSVIFAQNKTYNMFFVKNKKDINTIPFIEAKNNIYNTVMKKREQNYLKEYFETLKITANIQILR